MRSARLERWALRELRATEAVGIASLNFVFLILYSLPIMALLLAAFLILLPVLGFAQTYKQPRPDSATSTYVLDFIDDVEPNTDTKYVVRLLNGDIVTGPIIETGNDQDGFFIKISTQFGRARIYAKEIAWMEYADGEYRHGHRGYLMPTAIPIGNDHFLGDIEIAFLYAGAGIGNVVSITAGRSFIPTVPSADQVSHVNLKVTVAENENGLVEGGKQFYAVGVTGTWLNASNFLGNVYGVATFTGKRTAISTMLFAKVAGESPMQVRFGTLLDSANVYYANGTIGVGLSMDSRFSDAHDLHFVGELWNNDITRPSNTVLYLGLRLANDRIAMDFGMSVFTAPAVVPTVAFAWTPFN